MWYQVTVELRLRECYQARPLEAISEEDWPRGYKTFSMLNSVEHEILNAHKYKNIKKFCLFWAEVSPECYFSHSSMLKCQQLLAF